MTLAANMITPDSAPEFELVWGNVIVFLLKALPVLCFCQFKTDAWSDLRFLWGKGQSHFHWVYKQRLFKTDDES